MRDAGRGGWTLKDGLRPAAGGSACPTFRTIPSCLIIAVLLACSASAQTVVIRLGSLAPKNSRWHQLLLQIGDDWKKASDGKVQLHVYAGGEQGDEPEMVQKMRIGELQAVAISGAGLSGIDASTSALQIPMMYDSWEQLDYVRDRIGPQLEQLLAKRGFTVLNWADTGWIRFFSKRPATTPDEFRKMKVAVLQGDAVTFELYKQNGFHPVSLAATDFLTGLQTGLIDSFQAPPMVALGSQWFGGARNMLDIKFAPLSGAALVKTDTWNRIPEAVRGRLLKIAQERGAEIRQEIRRMEDQSISMMQGFGLNVVHADAPAVAEWRTLIERRLWPALRGGGMPAPLFDQVRSLCAQKTSKSR